MTLSCVPRVCCNRQRARPLGVDIEIDKLLPMGAGLGGGSSDAATTLLALNRLWGLDLSRQALQDLALKLGADVPFFVFGQNAFAEGVGEALQVGRSAEALFPGGDSCGACSNRCDFFRESVDKGLRSPHNYGLSCTT